MRALGALLGGALIALAWPGSAPLAADGDPAHGAQVYNARCVLCHGGKGMGEGFLPLKLDDYPSTNLRDSDAVDLAVIERAVRTGSGSGEPSPYSPPWQNELGDDDIRDVAAFVRLLRTDVEAAIALLDATHDESVRADGGNLYATRCAICHGVGGTGDGKMSKIIKSPPPFDLTRSVMPRAYLAEIISKGGEALMRSPKMPPWGEELSAAEIEAVIDYIVALRTTALSHE